MCMWNPLEWSIIISDNWLAIINYHCEFYVLKTLENNRLPLVIIDYPKVILLENCILMKNRCGSSLRSCVMEWYSENEINGYVYGQFWLMVEIEQEWVLGCTWVFGLWTYSWKINVLALPSKSWCYLRIYTSFCLVCKGRVIQVLNLPCVG